MNRVLVLDSHRGSATSLIRSLGARGVRVTAAGKSRYLPGMLSQFAADRFVHPDPRTDVDGFVDRLSSHLADHDYVAVFALTDRTTSVLSQHKERLAATGTLVAVEDWGTFLAANDKGKLFDRVPDDVPAPETYTPESVTAVDEVADRVSYPALIKPRLTSEWDAEGRYRAQGTSSDDYVNSPAELRRRYRERVESEPLLRCRLPAVQEYVPGGTMATVALADEGEVRSYFQHEHLRKTDGGTCAIIQGTRAPRALSHTERIVDELGWTGPLHVEFIHGPDDRFYLIEVNGRYWGGLPLAINSGVDIPWLHFQQLLGHDVERPDVYRTDVKQRILFHSDAVWFAQQLSRGQYGAVGPFLTAFGSTTETFLSARDPYPLAGMLWYTAQLATAKVT